MKHPCVLARTFADGNPAEVIGPFDGPGAARSYASRNYPRLPVFAQAELPEGMEGSGFFTVLPLVAPRDN